MKLPVPVNGKWTPEFQAQLNAIIEEELRRRRGAGDIELQRDTSRGATRDEQLYIRDSAGVRWTLYDLAFGQRWDDLRFPAQGINPAGSAAPPGVNTTDGLLDFDHNATEIIAGVAQMPHAWDGSNVRPHVHLLYRAATAGNSVWTFEYKIANVNANFPANYTSDTKTHTGPASAVKHEILAFDEIDMTGFKDSCCILWRLSRIGGNGSDTFGSDVALIEFDIHYRTGGGEARGSVNEYPT